MKDVMDTQKGKQALDAKCVVSRIPEISGKILRHRTIEFAIKTGTVVNRNFFILNSASILEI